MNRKQIKATEEELLKYFGLNPNIKLIVDNQVNKLSYLYYPEENITRLYLNNSLFFQTSKLSQLKSMLKLLFDF